MFVVDYFQDCSDCEVEFWVFLSFQAGIEDRDSSSTIGDDVDDDELVRLLLADAEEESSIAAEEWSEKVTFKLDVGSVWAVSKTLRAYRVRPGLHRMNVRKGGSLLESQADFTKKSSLEEICTAVTLIQRSDFVVKVFLLGLSCHAFLQRVLIPALKDMPHKCRTSYMNGNWLWSNTPYVYFKQLSVRSIIIHTDDFDLMEGNIQRHLSENFADAQVRYGLYDNGIVGAMEYMVPVLKDFLVTEHLELLIIHQGVELQSENSDYFLSVSRQCDLQGITRYHYLGYRPLLGFTCNMREGIPGMITDVGARVTHVQGYYPVPAHAANEEKHTNMPITLGAMYGFRGGSKMLDEVKTAALSALASHSSSLSGFRGSVPYRLELVTEWRDDLPLSEVHELLSSRPIEAVLKQIRDQDMFEQHSCAELHTHLQSIQRICNELQQCMDDPIWPLDMPSFSRIAGLEAILKACVQGSTQFVNYRTLKAALGDMTLAENVDVHGIVTPSDEITIDEDLLLMELWWSEREHSEALHLWLDVISGNHTGPEVAGLVVDAISRKCTPSTLTERAVLRCRKASIKGSATMKDVMTMLSFMGEQSPIRTFIAMLVIDGVQVFDPEGYPDFDRALCNVLMARCQVFPMLRPVRTTKDSYSRFMRLSLTTESTLFNHALHFMECDLRPLTCGHPAVVACMSLARHMAGTDGQRLINWTAWLMVLLLTSWDEQGIAQYVYFSWSKWHELLGWEEYGTPLLTNGIVELLTWEERENLNITCKLFGRYKLKSGFVRRVLYVVDSLEESETDGDDVQLPSLPAHSADVPDSDEENDIDVQEDLPVDRLKRRRRDI